VKTIAFTDGDITGASARSADLRKAATELTISGGAVTKTALSHTIDGETDLDDDLATINGGTEGDFLLIYPANDARNITTKHGTGNIVTGDGADYLIPDNGMVWLYYDGSNWRVTSGSGSGSAIGITPAGVYSALTTYAEDDGVSYDGSYYRSLADANTDNQPDTSPASWEIMVSKGDTGATGAAGSNGTDGTDTYTYVAYASDGSGTDWNLTPSGSLKYRAEIHSATELTPIEADFSAATWVKYIGDDGAGETNTASNVGTAGVGIFKQKATADLELYKILGSDGVTITLNGTDYIDIKLTAKPKYDATAAPAATDDTTDGYSVGSSWYDVTNDSVYFCVDATEDNAVWWSVGNVVGPASATDGNVPQYDGVTGKLLKGGLTVGTGANNLVQLDGDSKLPAVDGSQLTNLPGGGGGTPILSSITAESFIYPKTGITNPFTDAANSPNISFDVDNYADAAALLSTSANEPMQLPKFKVPTGTTSLKFRFVYEPETGNSWSEETVIFKCEWKNMTDNAAWSAVTAKDIGTDTVPASGSAPQLYEATISLATLGLAVGDVVQMVVFIDTLSTWAHDVAFELCEIEVVQ
jgi:hypothetical protein